MKTIKVIGGPIRFIRMPEVKNLTGLSKETIYRMIRAGEFPKIYKIGKAASAWNSEEVYEWLQSKLKG